MTKDIKHKVTIRSTPEKVFAALMDSKQHAGFTNEPARISSKVGGKFTCYGGYIEGIHLELEPGRLIVQAWRSQNWPKGYYSVVTFKLAGSGANQTTLTFTQVGVPAADYERKNLGWRTHYWQPLKRFLEQAKES